MPNDRSLRKQLRQRFDALEDKQRWFHAFTGNTNGVIEVPNVPGYIYIRDYAGYTHVAYNAVVSTNRKNLPIRVGYDRFNQTRLIVLGVMNAYVPSGGGAGAVGGEAAIGNMVGADYAPHHSKHEAPDGEDIVWVQGQQIIPALLFPSKTLTIKVYPFWCPLPNGLRKYIPRQDIDLSSYKPLGARWILLCVDISGNVVIEPSASVPDLTMLTASVPPPSDRSLYVFGAVRMYAGQTVISPIDIADLRWMSGSNNSPFEGIPSPNGVALPGILEPFARGDHTHPWVPTNDIIGLMALASWVEVAVTTDLDNWAPANIDRVTVIRITSLDASHNLNGLTGGRAGRIVFIINDDNTYPVPFPLTIKDNAGSSAAANRFSMNGGDVVLEHDGVAIVIYDPFDSLWKVVSGGGGGGGIGDMLKAIYDVNNNGVVDDAESTQALQGNAIDPALTPTIGHTIAWDGTKYVDSTGVVSYPDDLTAQVTGATAHFTTAFAFIPGTLQVMDDGSVQNYGAITEDITLDGFTLDYTPTAGHDLFVRYLIASSPMGSSDDMHWAQLLVSQLMNEIKGWPPATPLNSDLDALNLWWDKQGTPTTAPTLIDVSAAGLTDTYETALKVVADAASEGLYQRWTYADEPRVKAGRKLSALVAIWSVSAVSVTAKLVNSDATHTDAAATIVAGWTIIEIPNHTLAGTYCDLQITAAAAGTFYVVPLGANIGARALPLKSRGLVYKRLNVPVDVLAHTNHAAQAQATISIQANTSKLAVQVLFHLDFLDNTSTDGWDAFLYVKVGDAATYANVLSIPNVAGTRRIHQTVDWRLDDAQQFDYSYSRWAGSGTLEEGHIYVYGWWEWE